jgi:D-alanyl-D-alanine-carboxypeptidase/D-alanyl-D-alanine-endopeptidase
MCRCAPRISVVVRAAALCVFWLVSGCARERIIPPDEAEGLRLCRENLRQPNAALLTDAEVQSLLDLNAGPDGQADGLVVGIVDEHGARVLCAGTTGAPAGAKVDGDTLFRIGSVTKVFTAILLQDMIDRGEMDLDAPVQKYLPPSVKMPTFGGKEITLFHLATHTSGLPRDCATTAAPTLDELYAFLSSCKLPYEPGSRTEYSNLGMGLLGHAITLRAGKDYETLVVERICRPLGMESTGIRLTPALASRAALGHAFPGKPVASVHVRHTGPLEGCGALHSTANDLLKFLSANLGLTDSPVTPLLARTYAIHSSAGRQGRLGWEEDAGSLRHGGDVVGFRSDVGFDPARRRGVVLLANCFCSPIRADFKPILDERSFRPSRSAEIDRALLDDYVGTYQNGAQSTCVVRREGDRLTFQWWVGRPWLSLPHIRREWFPQSRTVFLSRSWPDPAIFIRDGRGRVTGLVVGTATWTKIADEPPQRADPIDPAAFNDYCGQYRVKLLGLFPVGPTLNVYCREDDLGAHLMVYAPHLPPQNWMEVFPAVGTTVIAPAFDGSWITFRRGSSGKATGVLLHMKGKDIRGWRISDDPAHPPGHEGGRR